MKRVKSFEQFVNENLNEGSVKVPNELMGGAGETSEMYPEDYDSKTEKKITVAQKKYDWVIDDYAASDILGMDIEEVKEILDKNKIKYEVIDHSEGTIVMF